MIAVPQIKDLDMAFGSITHLPPLSKIPKEFQDGKTEWNKIFSKWFYTGLPGNTEFYTKEGVEARAALRAIKAIMKSYEPTHEHKEVGVAYLMSEWFERVVIPEKEDKKES